MTDIISEIISREWEMFQAVNNEGGRAECQNNFPMFRSMRYAQFSAWPDEICALYLDDIRDAENSGRNLVEEKYARMMSSTAPEKYAELEKYLPVMTAERKALAEKLGLRLAKENYSCSLKYPHIASHGRPVFTCEDRPCATSVETYMRGELCTYSERTLTALEKFMSELENRGETLGEKMLMNTVAQYGYESLEQAEKELSAGR